MSNQGKKTLVLGASENPARYSFLAINSLRKKGHPVVAIGRREGTVADVALIKDKIAVDDLDTVTLYLSEAHQQEYEDYILSLKPRRIIFNPGAENEELERRAREQGIQTMEACTLVMLSTGQY